MHYLYCEVFVMCRESLPFQLNTDLLYFFPTLRKKVNQSLLSSPYQKLTIILELTIDFEVFQKMVKFAELVHDGHDGKDVMSSLHLHVDYPFFYVLRKIGSPILEEIMRSLPQYANKPVLQELEVFHQVFSSGNL